MTAAPPVPLRRLCRRLMIAGLAGLAALTAVFLIWPEADLPVSAAFVTADRAFPMRDAPVWIALRWGFRLAGHAVFVLLIAAGLWSGRRHARRLREGTFALAVYAIGSGLIVNWGLKGHWGRARPRDITLFGGDRLFTPPLTPADQCLSDCSFSSGEAALMTGAALTLLLTLAPRLASAARGPVTAAMLALAATGAALRIPFGGHFLSDVLFSVALMTALVPALWLAIVQRD